MNSIDHTNREVPVDFLGRYVRNHGHYGMIELCCRSMIDTFHFKYILVHSAVSTRVSRECTSTCICIISGLDYWTTGLVDSKFETGYIV